LNPKQFNLKSSLCVVQHGCSSNVHPTQKECLTLPRVYPEPNNAFNKNLSSLCITVLLFLQCLKNPKPCLNHSTPQSQPPPNQTPTYLSPTRLPPTSKLSAPSKPQSKKPNTPVSSIWTAKILLQWPHTLRNSPPTTAS